MLIVLINFLRDSLGWNIPAAFTYTSTRMLFAALFSLALAIFWGPWFIRKLYEMKIGQHIRKDECPLLGKLHAKKQDTPTMGGILILSSMLLSLLLFMNLSSVFTVILLWTTLSLGFIGGRDDYLKLRYKNPKGLSMRKKMLFQGIIAFAIIGYILSPFFHTPDMMYEAFGSPSTRAAYALGENMPFNEAMSLLFVPFYKYPVLSFSGLGIIVLVVFYFCVIVGSSNAANLADGLDGLAAGLLILVAGSLGVFAFISNNFELARYLQVVYIDGSGEIAVYLSALIGGCLGFLWYNGHPAQLFMGDTGSLPLGGIIGVSAVLLGRSILLAIVGGLFVVEALSVIIQVASFRYRNKKRVFLCAPLHHHFEYKGWPETKVVLRFWIIGLLLALVGIASLKLQ